jgi:hypothetical protein
MSELPLVMEAVRFNDVVPAQKVAALAAYCGPPAQPPVVLPPRRLSLSTSRCASSASSSCCKLPYPAAVSHPSCAMIGCSVCAVVTVVLMAGAFGAYV